MLINNRDEVLGIADLGGSAVATLAIGPAVADLNALAAIPNGEVLWWVYGTNDRGEIVAQSSVGNWYLLRPKHIADQFKALASSVAGVGPGTGLADIVALAEWFYDASFAQAAELTLWTFVRAVESLHAHHSITAEFEGELEVRAKLLLPAMGCAAD